MRTNVVTGPVNYSGDSEVHRQKNSRIFETGNRSTLHVFMVE